jgi:2-phosphosulfolactate phosphatase
VTVYPYPMGEGAGEYALERDAQVADKRLRQPDAMTLAPSSMVKAKAGARLVLPSRNGSALAFQAANSGAAVIAGSLRNASSVSAWANRRGGPVTVVPGGERWPEDLSLRPAFEDIMGAGAIISGLKGKRSPEAAAMAAAFRSASSAGLLDAMKSCSSGLELIEAGYEEDVTLAADIDVSVTVPLLRGDAFVDVGTLDGARP